MRIARVAPSPIAGQPNFAEKIRFFFAQIKSNKKGSTSFVTTYRDTNSPTIDRLSVAVIIRQFFLRKYGSSERHRSVTCLPSKKKKKEKNGLRSSPPSNEVALLILGLRHQQLVHVRNSSSRSSLRTLL